MSDQPKGKDDSIAAADSKPAGPGMEWNGRKITDPSELPPELRPLLEDANHNGIPDLVEQGVVRPIILNGKLYRSVEEVPEPFRAEVAKALAARRAGATPEACSVEISRSFTVNGQRYASIEEVPAEQRERIRQAMSKMIGEKPKPAQAAPVPSKEIEFPWAVPESRPTSTEKPRSNLVLWVSLAAAAGAVLTYLLIR
jgi:hypothetical protein